MSSNQQAESGGTLSSLPPHLQGDDRIDNIVKAVGEGFLAEINKIGAWQHDDHMRLAQEIDDTADYVLGGYRMGLDVGNGLASHIARLDAAIAIAQQEVDDWKNGPDTESDEALARGSLVSGRLVALQQKKASFAATLVSLGELLNSLIVRWSALHPLKMPSGVIAASVYSH